MKKKLTIFLRQTIFNWFILIVATLRLIYHTLYDIPYENLEIQAFIVLLILSQVDIIFEKYIKKR